MKGRTDLGPPWRRARGIPRNGSEDRLRAPVETGPNTGKEDGPRAPAETGPGQGVRD